MSGVLQKPPNRESCGSRSGCRATLPAAGSTAGSGPRGVSPVRDGFEEADQVTRWRLFNCGRASIRTWERLIPLTKANADILPKSYADGLLGPPGCLPVRSGFTRIGFYPERMSLDSALSFYDDVASGKIALDFSNIDSSDHHAMMAYAHSFGYDFTEDEMLEALNQNGASITMEEAEAIAGGNKQQDEVDGATGGVIIGGVVASSAAACA
jgi:hypothetical protein